MFTLGKVDNKQKVDIMRVGRVCNKKFETGSSLDLRSWCKNDHFINYFSFRFVCLFFTFISHFPKTIES